ncbi:MAG: hypothetical protein KC441_02990 [Anaerolineales bacterium]|nr:hypothetical protein [Anaerolineales bacterium]
MFRNKREPGDGFGQQDIYEVWGDVVADAADAHERVIAAIRQYLEDSYLAEHFQCQVAVARDGRSYLSMQWGDMRAEVDARPFGEHLDVYGILATPKGLTASPDPAARIANLNGGQRRDLQVFQTILKQAMEHVLEALDDGILLS